MGTAHGIVAIARMMPRPLNAVLSSRAPAVPIATENTTVKSV